MGAGMTDQVSRAAPISAADRASVVWDTPAQAARYCAWGVPFVVRTSGNLGGRIPEPPMPGAQRDDRQNQPAVLFDFFSGKTASGRSIFVLAHNRAAVFASCDAQVAAQELDSLIHLRVAALAREAVFVHAGVVGWGDRALVLPGKSHSGKSTLVAALVAAGATYYSDEYAVIDLQGRVCAFPRRLRLRPDVTREGNGGGHIGPPGLDGKALPASGAGASGVDANGERLPPLAARWVLHLEYRPGAVWKPAELTPGQTLLTLLENTVAVRRQSELTLRTLKLALADARGWQSERGEAAESAAAVVSLLERGATPHGLPEGLR